MGNLCYNGAMGLSDNTGKKYSKYVKDYCVFDLETTGISPNYDSVVEISAVKVIGGEVVDEYTTLVNPHRPIPYGASHVNGITDDMVKDAPDFEVALKEFLDFAGDLVLVGHNIGSFDMKFLYRDAMSFWGKTVGNDFIDTLYLSRACLPQLHHHTLTDLADIFNIDTKGAHRALNDCRMNQQVYEHLGEIIDNPSAASDAVKKCPQCGNLLKKRNGRFGEFWGCTGYPNCRYTENI